MTMFKWSTTAASNATADSTTTWPEGMAASGVNDSARGLMAGAAKYRDDVCGTLLTSGGSSNAFTVTTNQTITSLTDGFKVSFVANHTNTGAATLAVDGMTAKPLRVQTGTAVPAGALVSGSVYTAAYEAGVGEWLLHGFFGNQTEPPGIIKAYAGASAPTGYLMCYGQAISRTTYAGLFAVFSTTFGGGDGSTTFNIPDLRGRVIAGVDNMGGTSANRLAGLTGGVDGDALGNVGGVDHHYLTAAQLPSNIPNSATSTSTTVVSNNGNALYAGTGGPIAYDTGAYGAPAGFALIDATTATTTTVTINPSGSDYHNNVQPTMVLNYLITI